ncbi:UDP-N-acetylmuramoyl-L-alanyl-D-glutamate--2,6-diaminopimelate ligase [Candidatus Hakubella thermalkaliphila]|uniref:UDP-N-acetylmuramoyl-L-alanyl-D-glutamate--2,6-diaminopimelate ligase n=1 Tax=Candidatus Hakubella thermalkaliphila TaxID=2754717 RepID=A0A6V8NN89_9ACTN|nr:UDP-N-acetylmuramoyl-L-alanyl-D-glutamate--2,6-diaminopimelate ligase [Candidatus Hakubella thermalkaliphila]GFP20804.1 UDP-N-acetylmuramoyl-L-alanyl-D-glutamate--2,6-diaminopimelate ligase [Candidatus Hakubella thermalkaliphila]
MRLDGLIKDLIITKIEGPTTVDISGISFSSQEVLPGHLFVAIRGFRQDGHSFVPEAVSKGARAVLVQSWQEGLKEITQIAVPDTRRALARVSCQFYDHPSHRVRVVGITGTNGKTTTCFLSEAVLRSGGYRTALFGTVTYRIDDVEFPGSRTTPESLTLNQFLDHMSTRGVDVCVMEVSSHGVALRRVDFLSFETVVFTNLSQDHLDFHGTMDRYFAVKRSLFVDKDGQFFTVKNAVINIDDEHGRQLVRDTHLPTLTFSFEHAADIRARQAVITEKGTCFVLNIGGEEIEIKTSLSGNFNIYNILAAAGAGHWAGISLDRIKAGIESVTEIPGRFQRIDLGQRFTVVVDYAHTPHGLENAIRAARRITQGRLITVFGCGGDRDRGKRPLMGSASGELSDFTIITSDNPRSEGPLKIIEEIEKGIRATPGRDRYLVVEDREEAIRRAIGMARAGDFVLIAGKGHERVQEFAGYEIEFDDREVAQRVLAESL